MGVTTDVAWRKKVRKDIDRLTRAMVRRGSGGGGGVAGVPLPDPWTAGISTSVNADGSAGAWNDIDVSLQTTMVLTRPLWVMVEGAANIQGATSTYGMIGVDASGALTLLPETGPDGVVNRFGYTAFGEAASSNNKTLTFHKVLLLPAGTTTLTMKKRRSSSSGTPVISYPTMTVTPITWDTEGVPVPTINAAVTRRTVSASITGALTDSTIAWNVVDKNSGHFTYDSGTNEFIALYPGQYEVNTSIGMGSIGAGNIDYVVLTLVKNGAVYTEGLVRRDSLGGNTMSYVTTVELSAGDRLKSLVRTGQAGGSVAVVNAPRTYIELVPIVTTTADAELAAVKGEVTGMKMARGRVTIPSTIAVDASVTLADTFPVGLFSEPPTVTAMATNSRITMAISSTGHTKDGCNLSASNWSSATMPATNYVDWVAVGI